MNEKTKQQLTKAIEKHNQEMTCEEDRINLSYVIAEFATLDNEELETAARNIKAKNKEN